MKLEIPKELVSSLNKGKIVLFLGHDVDTSESRLPSIAGLASQLAQQTQAWMDCPLCDSAVGCTRPGACILPLRQVATIASQALGRDQLERFLKEKLTQNSQLTSTLQAITRLPVQIVITTAYDERLEEAYRAAAIRYQTVATDTQIVMDESAHVQIIHLYGVLSQPASLVLTEADHAALSVNKPLTSILLQSYLATRVCLFIATDFNDPYLQTLYSTTVKELGRLRQRPYVLEYQRKQSIVDAQTLRAAPFEFLVMLRSKLDYRPIDLPPPPKPEVPYKFLDYFESKDRAIFTGRDAEIRELTSRVISHRITVLSALSGRGKTSLLHAGVIPRLEFEGFRVEVIRPGANPLATIQAVTQAFAPSSDSNALPAPASQLSLVGQVLIIDQAEELFTVVQTSEARSAFVSALLAWLDNTEHNPYVLLSLRAEYQAHLEDLFEIQGRSDISSNRFRLGALGPEQARQAILKPAALFEIEFEEALTNALLAYLETADFDPPQLQIICHRLFQDLQESGEADPQKLTLARYERLGEAGGIIAGFLDDALARIGDEKIQHNAKVILKNMVTTQQTKVVLRAEEIARRVSYASLDETEVKHLLGLLQAQRIIRGLEDGGYELAHDVLAKKIWMWMEPADIARLNAAQTLRAAMSDYKEHRYLISVDKQIPIAEAAGALTLNADELALLLMSEVATDPYGSDRRRAQTWIKRIKETSDMRVAVLRVVQDAQKSQIQAIHDSALRAEVLVDPDMGRTLRVILTDNYNLSELQDLCFHLNVDFDQLRGLNNSAKVMELIARMARNGQLDVLFAWISCEYPDATKFRLDPPPPSEASILLEVLDREFYFEELNELCRYLGFRREAFMLREGSRQDYVRNLVIGMKRIARLDHLRLAIARFKPSITDVSAELGKVLVARFDMEQMRTICFDLGIDYENLNNSDKEILATDLVLLMLKRQRITFLIDAIIFPDGIFCGRYEVVLRRRLAEKMSYVELEILSFDLNVNWDDIAGDSLGGKSRELLWYFQRRCRLGDLVSYMIREGILSEDELWNETGSSIEARRLTPSLLRDMFGEVRLPWKLHSILKQCFNKSELQDLCFALGVDSDNLEGDTLELQGFALIDYMQRRGRLSELVSSILDVHPQLHDLIKEALSNESI